MVFYFCACGSVPIVMVPRLVALGAAEAPLSVHFSSARQARPPKLTKCENYEDIIDHQSYSPVNLWFGIKQVATEFF